MWKPLLDSRGIDDNLWDFVSKCYRIVALRLDRTEGSGARGLVVDLAGARRFKSAPPASAPLNEREGQPDLLSVGDQSPTSRKSMTLLVQPIASARIVLRRAWR